MNSGASNDLYADRNGLAAELRRLRETLGPDHPRTRAAFAARHAEVIVAELAAGERALYWLSFVGDEGFLGVAIVTAFGMADAIETAHLLGINPGGQVAGYPIPIEQTTEAWRSDWCDRLLTKDEAKSVPKPGSG